MFSVDSSVAFRCIFAVPESESNSEPLENESTEKSDCPFSVAKRVWGRIEDWSIVVALLAMMALPLLEIVMRQFDSGVYGGATILQHLVLYVAMIGSSIAAREFRLLSLSTFTAYLKGPWVVATKIISASFAFFVTSVFFVGSILYIQQTLEPDRVIFPGFPLWWAKAIMPVGFAFISVRLLWGAGDRWWHRVIPLLVAALLYFIGIYDFNEVEGFVWPLLILTLIATVSGAPIFVTLGGAAVILFWGWGGYYGDEAAGIVALNHYDLVKSPMLVTLPLFTLAGYLLAQGNSSQRLIRLIDSMFGGVRGSAAIVSVLVCAFFTTFTGASGVTILALGGLLYPILKASGYDERSRIGLLTGAGSLGVLFPPCLPLILYTVIASTANVSISLPEIFLGGAIPGTLLVLMTIFWGIGVLELKKNGFKPKELAKLSRNLFLHLLWNVAIFGVLFVVIDALTASLDLSLGFGLTILFVLSALGLTYLHKSLFPKDFPDWLKTIFKISLVLIGFVSGANFLFTVFALVIGDAASVGNLLLNTAIFGGMVFLLMKFFPELVKAMVVASGELFLPVVALAALFTGYATPVEAASVSAFYAFVLYLVDGLAIRKVNIVKELPKVMSECGLLVGGVLLILGVAFGFTNYLVTEMIPDQIVDWATTTIKSPLVFLLALNIFLIAVGCLMDIFSAIIVIVPLIVPLGAAFGIHPVHLGIVFLANLQLGYLTPPIGMNLFLASYRFNKPMSEVIRASLPMLFVFIIGVLVITYIPALTTWLPSLIQD